jgi:hypothetical protein
MTFLKMVYRYGQGVKPDVDILSFGFRGWKQFRIISGPGIVPKYCFNKFQYLVVVSKTV